MLVTTPGAELLNPADYSYTGWIRSGALPSFPRDASSSFPLPLGGEGRERGAAGATSSLWVCPPSRFDSACAPRPPSPRSSPPVGERNQEKEADATPLSFRRAAAVLAPLAYCLELGKKPGKWARQLCSPRLAREAGEAAQRLSLRG